MTSAAHTTDTAAAASDLASLDDEDDWISNNIMNEPILVDFDMDDSGPGPPPPPEFRIPPPPLPDFMLPQRDFKSAQEVEDFCQKTADSLDAHLAACDITFPSIESTSGHPYNSSDSHLQFMSLILGAVGLFFLGMCITIFVAWRRWRGRNRLNYLRKTSTSFETNPENSEHPLIYDDANINFISRSCTNAYLMDRAIAPRNQLPREDSATSQLQPRFYMGTNANGGMVTLDRPHHQLQGNCDSESRIYEEVFIADDVYGGSDHYSHPNNQVGTQSSALSSIKRMFSRQHTLNPTVQRQWEAQNTNCVGMQNILNGDYSAVYHPGVLSEPQQQQQQQQNNPRDLAESSFSSDRPLVHLSLSNSCQSSSLSGSSGGRQARGQCAHRQPSSSCSCSSSSCQEESGKQKCASMFPSPLEDETVQCNLNVAPPQQPLWPQQQSQQQRVRQVGYSTNLPSSSVPHNVPCVMHPSRQSWNGKKPVQTEGFRQQQQQLQQPENNNSFGIFSSLWRKRSRTSKPTSVSLVSHKNALSQQTAAGTSSAWMTLRVPPVNVYNPCTTATGANLLYEDNHNRGTTNQQDICRPNTHNMVHGTISNRRGCHSIRNELYGSPANQSSSSGGACRNNNGSGSVMPNPDDILPKEAWTDFSGTDEWPRFTRRPSEQQQVGEEDGAAKSNKLLSPRRRRTTTESSNLLYVNCKGVAAEDNGNSVCSQNTPEINGHVVVEQQQQQPLENNNNPDDPVQHNGAQQETVNCPFLVQEKQAKRVIKNSRPDNDLCLPPTWMDGDDDEQMEDVFRGKPRPLPRNSVTGQRRRRTKEAKTVAQSDDDDDDDKSDGELERSPLFCDTEHRLVSRHNNSSSREKGDLEHDGEEEHSVEWHHSPLRGANINPNCESSSNPKRHLTNTTTNR